jgi:hypothetical protein
MGVGTATLTKLFKLNDQDLTLFTKPTSHKVDGAEDSISSESIINSNEAVLIEKGTDALEYQLDLFYNDGDEAYYDQHAYAATLVSADSPGIFYPGRADRWAVVERAVHYPKPADSMGSKLMLNAGLRVFSPVSEHFGGTVQTWDPAGETLPQVQTGPFENDGNLAAPLYSLGLASRGAGPALRFDGSDDYIVAPLNIAGEYYFSVEIKMRYESNPAGKALGVSYGDSATTSGHFHFYFDQDANAPVVKVGDGASGESHVLDSIDLTDEWIHLGFTVFIQAAVTVVTCHINGVLHDSAVCANPIAAATTSLYIGKHISEYGDGSVAFCRVWSRDLSGAEWAAAYAGEAVSDTDLELEWDFCEGWGSKVYDRSGNSVNGTLTNFADVTAGAGDSGSGWLTNIGLANPEIQFLDAAPNLMNNIVLHSAALTSEVLSVDRRGHLSLLYENDFAANTGRRFRGGGYGPADFRSWAKLATDLTGDNNDLVFTAVGPGLPGEEVSVAYVNPGGTGDLSIGVSGYAITATLAVSSGVITSTARSVMDAMNLDSDVLALVSTSLAANNTGEGLVTAMSQSYLSLDVEVDNGLVIGELREAEVRLEGLIPIKEGGAEVTFTPSVSGAGLAYLESSPDAGGTWNEVSSSVIWSAGAANAVKVPDAEGMAEAYIRWRTEAGAELTITDLSISQKRYVSSSLVPRIPPYTDYYLKIDGNGEAGISADFYSRFKP